MGKCIKCGKETKNEYVCKIGQYIKNSTISNTIGNTTTYTSRYRVIQEYKKNVCSRCIWGIKIWLCFIFEIVIIIVTVIGWSVFIKSDSIKNGNIFFFMILGTAMINVIPIYFNIEAIKQVFFDERAGIRDEFTGSRWLSKHLLLRRKIKSDYPGSEVIWIK